jgi:hypothetical protein
MLQGFSCRLSFSPMSLSTVSIANDVGWQVQQIGDTLKCSRTPISQGFAWRDKTPIFRICLTVTGKSAASVTLKGSNWNEILFLNGEGF